MREDDSIRLYAPVLRRIIILVAVIITVPVVLWTITTFMRTYVGPPKIPTFRSIASTTPTATPSSVAADTGTTGSIAAPAGAPASQSGPVIMSFASTTPDTNGAGPAPRGDQLNSRGVTASTDGARLAMAAPATASQGQPAATDNSAVQTGQGRLGATFGDRSSVPALTVEPPQAASGAQEAEALPATPPLAGPIPLPHPRPHNVAVAEAGIPMPRPRPADSVDTTTAPETNSNPLGWLGNIFRPQQQPEPQQ